MSILWIILIVILVLALLGFFSRGRWFAPWTNNGSK
jgi:flagellar basal body-associated protein FliL